MQEEQKHKYQKDRQQLRLMHEQMRKDKIKQMMGLDEIAELTETQVLSKEKVN